MSDLNEVSSVKGESQEKESENNGTELPPLKYDVLINNGIKVIKFLADCHSYLSDMEEEFDSRKLFLMALNRYLKLWLPLLISNAKIDNLVVPIDIAWVWHIHKLHPVSYIEFINRLTKEVKLEVPNLITSMYSHNPDLTSSSLREIEVLLRLLLVEYPNEAFACVQTVEEANDTDVYKLWTEAYPNESFILDPSDCSLELDDPAKLGFRYCNVVGSAINQRIFLFNISTPLQQERSTMEDAVRDYRKFLNLVLHYPEATIVPRFDIDHMWHTHMTTSPVSFVIDSLDLLDYIVDHDDGDTDKGPDSMVMQGFRETCKVWSELYQENYDKEGRTEDRGLPGKSFYTSNWVRQFSEYACYSKEK